MCLQVSLHHSSFDLVMQFIPEKCRGAKTKHVLIRVIVSLNVTAMWVFDRGLITTDHDYGLCNTALQYQESDWFRVV